jgi:hypothetical protein
MEPVRITNIKTTQQDHPGNILSLLIGVDCPGLAITRALVSENLKLSG